MAEQLDIEAIEARANAALLGPWKYSFESIDPEWAVVTTSGGACIANVNAGGRQEANASFLAHAGKDVPALIAEVRRLRAENERLRKIEAAAKAAEAAINPKAIAHRIAILWGAMSVRRLDALEELIEAALRDALAVKEPANG